ncbi:hypothetical protein [Streptomyces niveiscabiei]|uniref:hypothetical protein n=1 Tax=Streptomyces niveiscabiei TaxID=164115 RepID=UPI0029C9C79C|nr:hypothetical protein [Streptomyces niveiscabiei]
MFDRQTGTFTEQLDASARFRSASVVKPLLALDFLRNRSPDHAVPAADRARLEPLPRGSDDDAAHHHWSTCGGSAIVNRMAGRLGLQDTAPAPVRDFVMGNLRQSTRRASDGFDQHFGIAGAFDKPWAAKQGWAGSSYPKGTCPNATATAASTRVTAAADVDLTRPALHSTGTVGARGRSIVAVYTLHPAGTAYTDIGRLTRSLDVPGATRPGGWISTIYVSSPDDRIPDVKEC